MKVLEFPADSRSVEAIIAAVREIFLKKGMKKEERLRYELLTEEILLKLIENKNPDSTIQVKYKRVIAGYRITFSCEGKHIFLNENDQKDLGSTILLDYEERLSQNYRHGINYITLSGETSSNNMLLESLGAMLLAILTGMLLRAILEPNQFAWLIQSVFDPMLHTFVKILTALAVPMAFLALVAYGITINETIQQRDHRIVKITIRFIASSLMAILIAILVWWLLRSTAFFGQIKTLYFVTHKATDTGKVLSGIGAFLSVFPDNLMNIFTDSNPLPMLIFALILAVGINSYNGKGSTKLKEEIMVLEGLFSRLLNLVYRVLPLFVFIAVLNSYYVAKINGLLYERTQFLLWFFAAFFIGILLLLIYYALSLLMNGISPIRFIKKYKKILWENIMISSNVDALPYNNRMFRNLLDKDQNPAFIRNALKLGVLINMDGNCLIITFGILYYITLSGLAIAPVQYTVLGLIILLLSLGAPNQPGSYLICTFILIRFLNLQPQLALISIIIEALSCKWYSGLNCIGDIITMAIFADNEIRN